MRGSITKLLLFCAFCSCVAVSCRPERAPLKPALSLDPGFEALFPTMSAALANACGRSREPGNPGIRQAAIVITSPYSALKILGPSASEPVGRPGPTGSLGEAGEPGKPAPRLLVVPFAGPGLASRAEVRAIRYDYRKAYAAMGADAAGILSRRSGGKAANCVIIFQPNFMRDESALDAFTAGFAASLDPGRLRVRKLRSDPDAVDPGGIAVTAIREAVTDDIGLVVLAIDSRAQASTEAAAAAARRTAQRDRPLAFFADMSTWDRGKVKKNLFALRIEGDEAALARAAIRLAMAPATPEAPRGQSVPALLVSLKIRKPFPQIF